MTPGSSYADFPRLSSIPARDRFVLRHPLDRRLQIVTIVLPEFLPRRWWQPILHNQTALLIKGALLFRRNTVVADLPYLLRR